MVRVDPAVSIMPQLAPTRTRTAVHKPSLFACRCEVSGDQNTNAAHIPGGKQHRYHRTEAAKSQKGRVRIEAACAARVIEDELLAVRSRMGLKNQSHHSCSGSIRSAIHNAEFNTAGRSLPKIGWKAIRKSHQRARVWCLPHDSRLAGSAIHPRTMQSENIRP